METPKPTPQSTSWFHGGVAGLQPGDVLLPPSATGTAPRWTIATVPECSPGIRKVDRVFGTPDRSTAVHYAHGKPAGTVYRVAPEGDILPDWHLDGLHFHCDSAVVLEVLTGDPVARLRLQAEELTKGNPAVTRPEFDAVVLLSLAKDLAEAGRQQEAHEAVALACDTWRAVPDRMNTALFGPVIAGIIALMR